MKKAPLCAGLLLWLLPGNYMSAFSAQQGLVHPLGHDLPFMQQQPAIAITNSATAAILITLFIGLPPVLYSQSTQLTDPPSRKGVQPSRRPYLALSAQQGMGHAGGHGGFFASAQQAFVHPGAHCTFAQHDFMHPFWQCLPFMQQHPLRATTHNDSMAIPVTLLSILPPVLVFPDYERISGVVDISIGLIPSGWKQVCAVASAATTTRHRGSEIRRRYPSPRWRRTARQVRRWVGGPATARNAPA